MTIAEIIDLLRKQHGPPQHRPQRDPLFELIAAILSQNTSDANSERSFDDLVTTLGTWNSVMQADVDDIAAAISSGGLNRVKAPRIKAILEQVKNERGALDLGFLKTMPLAQARDWLESLPGVGPKTAACVLLFSLGRPALHCLGQYRVDFATQHADRCFVLHPAAGQWRGACQDRVFHGA